MIIPNAIFILGVVLAGLYLKFTGNPTSWLRSILKTLPVALFALAAIVYQGPVWLILALVFSAIGDLALSRPSTKWFLTGMIAFAAAHLGYIVLMFELGRAFASCSMAANRCCAGFGGIYRNLAAPSYR